MAGHLATDRLLDGGCGVGRLPIGLLGQTAFRGGYVDFDVSAKHVQWARRHLRPLAPLHRVLHPGGRVVATWFVWDEARRRDVETGDYPMVHQRDEHVL
jgi:SAM-dependent methyltransferase